MQLLRFRVDARELERELLDAIRGLQAPQLYTDIGKTGLGLIKDQFAGGGELLASGSLKSWEPGHPFGTRQPSSPPLGGPSGSYGSSFRIFAARAGAVSIGSTHPAAYNQEGWSQQVTRRQHRFLGAALGAYVPIGSILTSPARPLAIPAEPLAQAAKPAILKMVGAS